MAKLPSASSRSAKLRPTLSSKPSRCATRTARIASARSVMMTACRSAASRTIPYTVTSASAKKPGSNGDLGCGPRMRLDPLADLFADQAGRPPRHQRDHHREGEYVLVGAGERQRDRADGLHRRQHETAEERAVVG